MTKVTVVSFVLNFHYFVVCSPQRSLERPHTLTRGPSHYLVARRFWSTAVVSVYCHPWVAFCFANSAFYVIWTALLCLGHLHQMTWGNVTTNERINIDRYVEFSGGLVWPYSRTSKCSSCYLCGLPSSPYDRGLVGNLADLCRIRLGSGGDGGSRRSAPVDWSRVYDLESLGDRRQITSIA